MAPQTQSSTGYDPLSLTPYTPPQLPEVQAPPAPPPQQTSDQAPSQSGPKMLPTTGGKAAGAAYLVSSLLKGIAQGRAQAQLKQVAQAKKRIDGLQWSYNNDAAKLWSLKDADPNSQEYKDAMNGAATSWKTLNDAYQAYFEQGQKKPKQPKKSQGAGQAGGGGGAGQSPLSWVGSQDPQEKIAGILQMNQKVGPPVMWQLRDYNSPQAKQQRELAQKEIQAALDNKNKQLRLHELEKNTDALTDADPNSQEYKKAEMEKLQNDRELFPSIRVRKIQSKTTPDNHLWTQYEQPDGTVEWKDEGEVRAPASQLNKIGTVGAFMEQWAKENNIADPKSIPADTQRQLDQAWKAPAGITVSTHQGQVVWTDVGGHSWVIPIATSTSTSHTGGAMPKATSAAPPLAPRSTPTPKTGTSAAPSKTPAAAPATTSAADAPPPPPIPGARYLGKKQQSPEEKLQTAMASKDHDKAKKIVDDAKKDYEQAVARQTTMDQNIIAARNGDQQAMLSLVANHIGMTLGAQKGARITRAVWDEAVQSAPWTKTIYAKWFHQDPATGDMIFDGYKSGVTLTDQQMQQMVDLAHQKVPILGTSVKRLEETFKTDLNAHAVGGSNNTNAPSTTEKTPPHPVDQILDEMFKPKTGPN